MLKPYFIEMDYIDIGFIIIILCFVFFLDNWLQILRIYFA